MLLTLCSNVGTSSPVATRLVPNGTSFRFRHAKHQQCVSNIDAVNCPCVPTRRTHILRGRKCIRLRAFLGHSGSCLIREQRHEAQVDVEILAPRFYLFDEAFRRERFQIDRRGLAPGNPGTDDIADSAIRMHERQFDEFP